MVPPFHQRILIISQREQKSFANRLPLRAVNLTQITFREKIEKKQGKQKSIFFSLSFPPRM
ncbi:hypothetical protein DWW99_02755 [[Clostridium] leptum]|nr:hypothetical protein DWW99_02755 [[Clostridium] leptum]